MTKFEVWEPASSGQELIELAHQAEAYINNHTRKQRTRSRDAISELNYAAAEMYIDKPVWLTGVMLAAGPDEAKTSPETALTAVVLGNIKGLSLGFRAINLYGELDKLAPNVDADGLEMIDLLRTRAYGQYAVCHLISYKSNNWESDNFLTDTEVTYRVAGPISSSYLFADGKYNLLTTSDRSLEVARIIDLMRPVNQMRLNHICTSVSEGEDAVASLAASSEAAKELFSNVNHIERQAIINIVEVHLRLSSSDKRFCFTNGLPTSLVPVSDESSDICSFDGEHPYFIDVQGVAVAPDYDDVDPSELQTGEKMQLLIKTTLTDVTGAQTDLLIPAQHIGNYAYQRLGR